MKFKLTLNINRKYGSCLPFNYQYEQSAVVYSILAQADRQYSAWLHENGYMLDNGKRFKLFSYSPFFPTKYRAIPSAGCLEIISDKVIWYISFIPEKSTVEFIQGLFDKQYFVIGNKKFKVAFDIVGVEAIPSAAVLEEIRFKAQSPVCIKHNTNGRVEYLSPDTPQFKQGILKGLMSKYESINGHPFDFDIADFDFAVEKKTVRSKLITIKGETDDETRVRGFLFCFTMKAPLELMRIACDGGIGEQCSQGFGFINAI